MSVFLPDDLLTTFGSPDPKAIAAEIRRVRKERTEIINVLRHYNKFRVHPEFKQAISNLVHCEGYLEDLNEIYIALLHPECNQILIDVDNCATRAKAKLNSIYGEVHNAEQADKV